VWEFIADRPNNMVTAFCRSEVCTSGLTCSEMTKQLERVVTVLPMKCFATDFTYIKYEQDGFRNDPRNSIGVTVWTFITAF
jgi:hypothetical protein